MHTGDNQSSVRPKRFNYQGSYRDPQKYHFGFGTWMSEDECRRAIAKTIRNSEIDPGSVKVVVQHKKSRWLHLANGHVSEIFPDVWLDYQRELAVEKIREKAKSASAWVQGELRSAERRGYQAALRDAQELVQKLEEIMQVTDRATVPTSETERSASANPGY